MRTEEDVLREFISLTKEMNELFEKKNHDYGNSFFQEENTYQDSFSNIKRKFARLKNFYETDKKPLINETVEDTLKDLAIYCTMEIIRLKNDK